MVETGGNQESSQVQAWVKAGTKQVCSHCMISMFGYYYINKTIRMLKYCFQLHFRYILAVCYKGCGMQQGEDVIAGISKINISHSRYWPAMIK